MSIDDAQLRKRAQEADRKAFALWQKLHHRRRVPLTTEDIRDKSGETAIDFMRAAWLQGKADALAELAEEPRRPGCQIVGLSGHVPPWRDP